MIGRLLTHIVDRIAGRLMDQDWLHDMWFREQASRQVVREQRQRRQNAMERLAREGRRGTR